VHYPWTATARAIKVQKVLLKAIGGQLHWVRTAARLGILARRMRRWKARYERERDDGLFDRRTRRPSPRRVPLPVVEQVLRLYRAPYFDVNVPPFHSQLLTVHESQLRYTWGKPCVQTAPLVPRRRRGRACSGRWTVVSMPGCLARPGANRGSPSVTMPPRRSRRPPAG